MKILLTGRETEFGQVLFPRIQGMQVIAPTKNEMDVTSLAQVKQVFLKHKPDITLHLDGFSQAGIAESEKRRCYKLNVLGTANIARVSKHLILSSTGFIFDGERGNYQEDDIPNPVNFCFLTQLLAEYEARASARYTIIRSEYLSQYKKNTFECTDMWTSARDINTMADEYLKALSISQHLPRVLHIGFARANLFSMVKEKEPTTMPIKRSSLPYRLPKDISLNTSVWKKLQQQYK